MNVFKSLNMMLIVFFLSFTFTGCTQNETNNDNKSLNLNTNKTMIQDSVNVPDEVKIKATKNILFIIASIARQNIDFNANSMYILDDNFMFTRIKNNENSSPKLFGAKCDVFNSKVDSIKCNDFINYLNSFDLTTIKQVYKTSDNVDIKGGSDYYVFMKNSSGYVWLCFEPESGDLINEIQKRFNMIF